MKIYRVEYTVLSKINGDREWRGTGRQNIDVAAPSVLRAIKAAEKHALAPVRFFDDDTKKMATERFKNLEVLSAHLLAEADIKG